MIIKILTHYRVLIKTLDYLCFLVRLAPDGNRLEPILKDQLFRISVLERGIMWPKSIKPPRAGSRDPAVPYILYKIPFMLYSIFDIQYLLYCLYIRHTQYDLYKFLIGWPSFSIGWLRCWPKLRRRKQMYVSVYNCLNPHMLIPEQIKFMYLHLCREIYAWRLPSWMPLRGPVGRCSK